MTIKSTADTSIKYDVSTTFWGKVCLGWRDFGKKLIIDAKDMKA